MLIGKIENSESTQKHSVLIATEFIIRESTARARIGTHTKLTSEQ
jgi:hypothetical protein